MITTALHSDTSDQIRRALELSDSSELLPHFSRSPRAVEAAMRSAIESLFALQFHRSPLLDRLEEHEEIDTALRWQIQILESFKLEPPVRINQILVKALEDHASQRLATWSHAIQEIEAERTEALEDLSVALSAAFRSYVRASADATEPHDSGGLVGDQSERVINAPPPGEMLDVTSAAERLNVSRPTIYEWLRKGRLIGWERGSKQGWVIPAEQIVGPERIAEGVDAVIAEIDDAELAWDFLSNPWPFSGGGARPMDKLLKGGEAVQQVVDAAPGYLVNMG